VARSEPVQAGTKARAAVRRANEGRSGRIPGGIDGPTPSVTATLEICSLAVETSELPSKKRSVGARLPP